MVNMVLSHLWEPPANHHHRLLLLRFKVMLITIPVFSTKKRHGTAKPFGVSNTRLPGVMSTTLTSGRVQTDTITGVITTLQRQRSESSKWPTVLNSNGINTARAIWIFVLQRRQNWQQIQIAILIMVANLVFMPAFFMMELHGSQDLLMQPDWNQRTKFRPVITLKLSVRLFLIRVGSIPVQV